MLHLIRKWRRKRVACRPFLQGWLEVLAKNFPLYAYLSIPDQQELQRHIQIFLSEKQFEGCGGLQMTEEIKVTIAAQACLLLLRQDHDYYPRVCSILVYPTAYIAPVVHYSEFGVATESKEARAGEASGYGAIVLSWEDVRYGAADVRDGKNVVLHEFAHALDMESNAADGAPVLPRRSMYVAWARVLGREYKQLQAQTEQGLATVMDPYGASNPAEFFAVATECFFEKPKELLRSHRKLYQQLKHFYQQDPIQFRADQCKGHDSTE